MKFIPKWCPAWWPALLCDPRVSLGSPSAGASGSGVPTGRRATRRPASPCLAPTLPHMLSPAPASPRGTNAPARLHGPGAYFLFRSASGRAWGCARSRQRAGPHRSLPAPAVRTMATSSRSCPRALRPGAGAIRTSRARGFILCSQQVGTRYSAAVEARLRKPGPRSGSSEALSAVRRGFQSLVAFLSWDREGGTLHAGSRSLPDHQAVRSALLEQDPAWPDLAASRAELLEHEPSEPVWDPQ